MVRETSMEQFDVAVVGGGAAGLMAAAAAAGGKASVVLLEKNTRVGKKLLLTGNGRCNLTNRHCVPERYHGDVSAADKILRRYSPETVTAAFRSMGLLCRELDEGRVYPYSLQASSVLNILRRSLERAGVRTECGFACAHLKKEKNGFLLFSADGTVVRARCAVVAAGGKACPQSGSDGSGYELLRPFGHTVTRLLPCLVQIRTEPGRVRPLKGVRCMAGVTLLSNGRQAGTSHGEVQFAEGALSGICIFDLSHFAGTASKNAEVSLDLSPDFSREAVAEFLLRQANAMPETAVCELMEGFLHKSLGLEIVKYAGLEPGKPAGSLRKEDIRRIALTVKDFRFPAMGTLSWQNAQVTAGGVPLCETDENLQSRFCAGLYLAGELLNVDGDCGGFNLQWAWASGLAAGRAAAAAAVKAGEN